MHAYAPAHAAVLAANIHMHAWAIIYCRRANTLAAELEAAKREVAELRGGAVETGAQHVQLERQLVTLKVSRRQKLFAVLNCICFFFCCASLMKPDGDDALMSRPESFYLLCADPA